MQTHAEADKSSLSVRMTPQGQQPTAAPVAPFQSLNDLGEQRLQNLDGEDCFIYKPYKWKFRGKFKEVSQMSWILKRRRTTLPFLLLFYFISYTSLRCRNRGEWWNSMFWGCTSLANVCFGQQRTYLLTKWGPWRERESRGGRIGRNAGKSLPKPISSWAEDRGLATITSLIEVRVVNLVVN